MGSKSWIKTKSPGENRGWNPEEWWLRQRRPKPTFRSPEMLAPARIPVADGKKMENRPKKEPSGPRQLGTKFWAKISAGEGAEGKRLGPSDRLPPG